MKKLNRRTFLRASGISLALPWLEAMGVPSARSTTTPKRFCSIYFPYGIGVPKGDHPDRDWGWFPQSEGRDFNFSKPLAPLEPMRDQISVLGGLSHPRMRGGGGHDSGDTFLTGAELRRGGGNMKNSISLDQVIAKHFGGQTRFSSLVFSNDGGVGIPTRSNTLSYTDEGLPIPSLNRPAIVFERLFGLNDGSIEAQRRGLKRTGSHLDLLLGEARGLNRKLGKRDQQKMDEYLTSVREVEQQVERSAAWLDVPKPKVNATGLSLDADDSTPGDLIQTMLDLIVLAFQTDSSRVATYQLASMHGAISIASKFPQLLGFGNNFHSLAHGANKPGGMKRQGEWARFLSGRIHYLLDRLDSIEEGDGTILDNTLVYYGSSNSQTHNNKNYPLILAGGKKMGFSHGQFLRYGEDTPLSNLYLTMLNQLGVPGKQFADSTDKITNVLT